MSAEIIPLHVCDTCGTFRTLRGKVKRALNPPKDKPWPCFTCVAWASGSVGYASDVIPTDDNGPGAA